MTTAGAKTAAEVAQYLRREQVLHGRISSKPVWHLAPYARRDPDCAMAYWGAAMTYNHPFRDPPTRAGESAAWALIQKGQGANRKSPREAMYLAAVAALFQDAGVGPKSGRDLAYADAMGACPSPKRVRLAWTSVRI